MFNNLCYNHKRNFSKKWSNKNYNKNKLFSLKKWMSFIINNNLLLRFKLRDVFLNNNNLTYIKKEKNRFNYSDTDFIYLCVLFL